MHKKRKNIEKFRRLFKKHGCPSNSGMRAVIFSVEGGGRHTSWVPNGTDPAYLNKRMDDYTN